MNQHQAVRGRLIRTYRKVIRENEQLLRDMLWWNNNRTEHPPFDCEPIRVTISLAKRILGIVEADSGPIPDELMQRFYAATQEPIST